MSTTTLSRAANVPASRKQSLALSPGLGLTVYLLVSLGAGLVLLRWQLLASLEAGDVLSLRHFATPLWTIVIGVLCNASCALLGLLPRAAADEPLGRRDQPRGVAGNCHRILADRQPHRPGRFCWVRWPWAY